jgi:putative effector of murein hydrolase LrgA (UPF0299 family)
MRSVQILTTIAMLVVMTRIVLTLLDDRPKTGIVVAVLVVFCLLCAGVVAVTWLARDVKP